MAWSIFHNGQYLAKTFPNGEPMFVSAKSIINHNFEVFIFDSKEKAQVYLDHLTDMSRWFEEKKKLPLDKQNNPKLLKAEQRLINLRKSFKLIGEDEISMIEALE